MTLVSKANVKKVMAAAVLFFAGFAGRAQEANKIQANVGVGYNVMLGKNSLYTKPLQASLGVIGRNLFGTQFFGFDLEARLPLSGPYNLNEFDIQRAQNGGKVNFMGTADIFIGMESENENGVSMGGGFTLGSAFMSTQEKGYMVPKIGARLDVGLLPGLDAGIKVNYFCYKSVFNEMAIPGGRILPAVTAKDATEFGLSLRYTFIKRKQNPDCVNAW